MRCLDGITDSMDMGLGELQERGAQSLGQGDTLEEEMETHSSIVVLEIPWTEELVGHN